MQKFAGLKKEQKIQLAAVLLIIAGFLTVIFTVDFILTSTLCAFVLSYLLAPLVNHLERRGIRRMRAVLIPFSLVLFTLLLISLWAVPLLLNQTQTLHGELPRLKQGVMALLSTLDLRLQNTFHTGHLDLFAKLQKGLDNQFNLISLKVPHFLSGLLTVSFLTPLISFFMLLDGRKMIRLLLSIVPNPLFELFLNLSHQINHQLGGFVRARLVESLMMSACVLVGLTMLQFPYALVLALIAGATNLIPYVGPIIGAVPALFMVFLSSEVHIVASQDFTLILVVLIYAFAQLVDVFIIIPLVVARIVNLHPLIVVLSILLGAETMGVLGMIVSIPIASVLNLVLVSLYQHMVTFRS